MTETSQVVKEQLEERKRNQLSAMFLSKDQQLCFDKSIFESASVPTSSSSSGSDFNVDGFIADCRARLPLETVLRDLQSYAGALTEAVLEAINKYFPSFSGIVGDLDASARLFSSTENPLSTISSDLKRWHTVLQEAITAVTQLEQEAAAAHERREALGRLRDAIAALGKLEELAAGGTLTSLERAAHLASTLEWAIAGPLKGYAIVGTIKERYEGARAAVIRELGDALVSGVRSKDEGSILVALRGLVALEKPGHTAALFRSAVVRPFAAQCAAREMAAQPNANGLKTMFAHIQQWVCDDCGPLLRCARHVSPHLELLGSIWAEVNETLAATVPSVFSPAMPDTFHQCFSAALGFLTFLEDLCADKDELTEFRAHPACVHLTKRWNTKIYFQIRAQEIAATFEASLLGSFRQVHPSQRIPSTTAGTAERGSSGQMPQAKSGFTLRPTATLWNLIQKCFNTETTFLPQLGVQFVRLALQLIARYSNWATDGAAAKAQAQAQAQQQQRIEEPWASMAPIDFVFLCHDINVVTTLVTGNLRDIAEECFAKSLPRDMAASAAGIVGEALDDAASNLLTARSKAEILFVEDSARKCCDSLQQMYSIMTTVRAGKAAPSQPSFYVSRVFESLCSLLNAGSTLVAKEERDLWATRVANSVFGRCTEICGELLTSAYRTDDMMQKMSSGAGPAQETGMTDTDKFLTQLTLDVKELGKIATTLGVETEVSEPFQRLCRCVKKI